jgi:hypothetical protein
MMAADIKNLETIVFSEAVVVAVIVIGKRPVNDNDNESGCCELLSLI